MISKIEPYIATPLGKIIIHCKNLDSWKLKRNSIKIKKEILNVEGSSDEKIMARIPSMFENGIQTIELKIDDKIHKAEIFIPQSLYIKHDYDFDFEIVDNPIIDNEGRLFTTYYPDTALDEKDVERNLIVVLPNPFDSNIKNEKLYLNNVDIISMYITNDNDIFLLDNIKKAILKYNHYTDYSVEKINPVIGIPSGLVVDSKKNIYYGNNNGEIYKVEKEKKQSLFIKLPASSSRYYMTIDKSDNIYLSNPNHIYSSKIYKISPEGDIKVIYSTNSILAGINLDNNDNLFFIENKRNVSFVKYIRKGNNFPKTLASGHELVGLTFSSKNKLILASKNSIYEEFDIEEMI